MQSMTGFGKSETTFNDKKISLEIRSLNSKNLDLNTRLPSFYKELEPEFRKIIIQTLNRGKVDLALFYEANGGENASEINLPIVQAYMNKLASFDLDESEKLKIAIRLPDTLKTERESICELEKKKLFSLLPKQYFRRLWNTEIKRGGVCKKIFWNALPRLVIIWPK